MCVLSIEMVWVEKYEKMGEKPPYLGFPEVWYRYQTVWYRYHIDSGRLVPVSNFRTSLSVLAITCSFLI